MAQTVKKLPARQNAQVPSLGREDPPEMGMAAHASVLAWQIPWTEGVWRATVQGIAKSQM